VVLRHGRVSAIHPTLHGVVFDNLRRRGPRESI
jgi:hypothetical protein